LNATTQNKTTITTQVNKKTKHQNNEDSEEEDMFLSQLDLSNITPTTASINKVKLVNLNIQNQLALLDSPNTLSSNEKQPVINIHSNLSNSSISTSNDQIISTNDNNDSNVTNQTLNEIVNSIGDNQKTTNLDQKFEATLEQSNKENDVSPIQNKRKLLSPQTNINKSPGDE